MDINNKGDLTLKAEDYLFALPEGEEEAVKIGLEYWFDSGNFTNFSDGLVNAAVSSGYNGKPDDRPAVCQYILHIADKAGIPLEKEKRNIQNWLNEKNPPSRNQAGRDTVFRICFALNMNLPTVKSFFRKVYWERPFNFRDISECVYYYCFQHGYSYVHAKEILKKVELEQKGKSSEEFTRMIPEKINAFLSEEEDDKLVQYLAQHYESFQIKEKTATQKIEALLKECKKCVDDLFDQFPETYKLDGIVGHFLSDNEDEVHDKKNRLKGNEKLLNFIYGIPSRTFDEHGNYIKKSVENDISGAFPLNYARSNLPSPAQLKSILNGRVKISDSIRKALILLDFFQFAANNMLNCGGTDHSFNDFYDDFEAEINSILNECGFPEIYLRNPYDWLFYYCASRDDPLSALREMLTIENRAINE